VKRLLQILIWAAVAGLGAIALGTIAFHRGEPINATWFVLAAACSYLVAYRLYSAFIAAKLLALDNTRATPAERLDDGRDFVPTNKWVLFGHHFAAIAGPGPLVGPTLAAQFGYLPGTLWLIAGAAFAGCVQDFVILFCSIRRDGKTLGEMARDEVSKRGGLIAQLAVLTIMIILLAVVALVVVNALKSSPWATFTLAMTIPIALLLGVYLRYFRPGRVLEASLIGVALVLFVVVAGQWVADSPYLAKVFTLGGVTLAFAIIAYGFAASALPVWLLLAPRDYLSAFIKAGAIFFPGRWNSAGAPSSSDASTHALRGRHRPGLRRKNLSLLFHHHRVRCDQRFPLSDLQRHHAKNDSARRPCPFHRLRRHAAGVFRRRDGHGRRVRDDAGRLLRHQQSRFHRRRHAGSRSRHDFQLGLSALSRYDDGTGSCRR